METLEFNRTCPSKNNVMNLRKGKTKSLLESSIDCALLAVEIYNKPRASFVLRVTSLT